MYDSSIALDLCIDKQQLSIKQSNQLLTVQKDILEAIVTGHDYQSSLDSLCIAAETILPRSIASVLLFDKTKKSLNVRAAPNISDPAIKRLNQLIPGEYAGSCGTAVFKGKPQFVEDTFSDKRWKNLRDFAEDFSIRACWSMPIVDRENKIIGSFALSSFKKRVPNHFQEILLYTASYLTSLILTREKEDAILQRAAHFDHLTQLPNRVYFDRRVEQAISQAKRNKNELSIFFIDLDNFKQINDNYGHSEGDKVLRSTASRMLECIRKEDTLARMGGDEFIILVEGNVDKPELKLIANKLLASFSKPIKTRKNKHKTSISIGISLYPKQGKTAQTIIKSADKAMYIAKSAGKNKFRFA